MPGTQPNNDLWFAQQLAQMKRDLAALKAQRTQFIIDSNGQAQAIIGDISHDPSGNSTGLSGFGVAAWTGSNWVGTQTALHELGDLIPSAANSRTGCLLCDGTAYTLSVHTELAPLGAACPAYVSSGVLTVPDLRGRVPMGAGTGPGLSARTLGQEMGEEAHLLSVAEMPSHTHPAPFAGGQYLVAGGGGNVEPIFGTSASVGWPDTGAEGGGGGHNNIQPSSVVNWFIYSGT